MGIYKQGGVASVNHVDTEIDGHGLLPQKDAWEATKATSGFVLCVASPASDHAITRAIVFRDSKHEYKVLEVVTHE